MFLKFTEKKKWLIVEIKLTWQEHLNKYNFNNYILIKNFNNELQNVIIYLAFLISISKK